MIVQLSFRFAFVVEEEELIMCCWCSPFNLSSCRREIKCNSHGVHIFFFYPSRVSCHQSIRGSYCRHRRKMEGNCRLGSIEMDMLWLWLWLGLEECTTMFIFVGSRFQIRGLSTPLFIIPSVFYVPVHVPVGRNSPAYIYSERDLNCIDDWYWKYNEINCNLQIDI